MDRIFEVLLFFLHAIGGLLVIAYAFLLIVSFVILDLRFIIECTVGIISNSVFALTVLYIQRRMFGRL